MRLLAELFAGFFGFTKPFVSLFVGLCIEELVEAGSG